jgi:putative oxygen-independent coproporphyrinogen III oxidase
MREAPHASRLTPHDLPPDSPQLADAAASWRSAYVHVPFCRSVCPYCDFAVVAGQERWFGRYVDALVAEISRSEPFDHPLDSLHVGGGTPTALPAASIERIVRAVDDHHGLASGAEVAVEANPEDLDGGTARHLAEVGVTRLSLGVQSFDPTVLASLGRSHTPDTARSAIDAALDAVPSVSVDLILGTPGETVASWERSLGSALERGIHHLSTYALTVERGTALFRDVAAGAPAPDPDDQADKWEIAAELAAAGGLVRYETSNHARPGHHSRYNLATWGGAEYQGMGVAAHRHRSGERSWNVRRLDGYLERVEAGEDPTAGTERLTERQREVERVLLGIRRSAGVEPGAAGAALRRSEWGRRLVDAGVITGEGRLVVRRPLLGDEVARALLALSG